MRGRGVVRSVRASVRYRLRPGGRLRRRRRGELWPQRRTRDEGDEDAERGDDRDGRPPSSGFAGASGCHSGPNLQRGTGRTIGASCENPQSRVSGSRRRRAGLCPPRSTPRRGIENMRVHLWRRVDITAMRSGRRGTVSEYHKGRTLYAATCRHCGRQIVQHPSGVWIPGDGSVESDPNGFCCRKSGSGSRPRMLHEPMPFQLAGAPRWLAGVGTDSAPQGASPRRGRGRRRRHDGRPLVPAAIRMRARQALARLRDVARFRVAWW